MNRSAAVALPVRQDTDAWLEERQRGIGSSDAPATVDLDPFSSRLEKWALKSGLIESRPPSDTMKIGKVMEPVIAGLYEEATGRKVRRRRQMLHHPEYPMIRASLDRVYGRSIVELKKSRDARGYGRSGTDQVPPYVLIQTQHQMLVTGYQVADVAVFVGGEDLRRYTIPADRGIQDRLLTRELAFWDCVLTQTPPTDIDGSEATRRYLDDRYPVDGGHQMIPDAEMLELAVELRDARMLLTLALGEEQRVVNAIKARMGDAALVEGPGWRITWKSPRPGQQIEWEDVARAIAPSDVALAVAIEANTTTKAGTRRFLPTFKGDPNA